MPTFPKYESYKDSGIEWLGEIPHHWGGKKLKFIAQQISEKIEMKEQSGMYLGLENIESWTGKLVDTELTVEGIANRFQENDLLFGKLRPYLAKVHLARQEGFCTTEALVLRFSKAEPKFFFYLLLSQGFIELVNSSVYGSKMPRASWEFIGSQYLPLPPLEEQKRIVEFLDRTTTEIDRAISQKQRLIELLQEQKAIVINQAVTKGLNPSALMHDSGIEWIGDIPQHWSIKRAKHISSIFVPQRNKPELNSSFGIPWITTEDLTAKAVSESKSGYFVSPSHAKQAGSRVLPENSVIASCVGTFGIASVNTLPVIINQQLQAFVPKRINPWYLRYAITTSKTYFELNSTSTTLAYVNQEGFSEVPLPCPPEAEQKEIVDFLDRKLIEIDEVIQIVEQQTSSIQNFRQILISQAVTGKIKV